jgi:hypothetical protein
LRPTKGGAAQLSPQSSIQFLQGNGSRSGLDVIDPTRPQVIQVREELGQRVNLRKALQLVDSFIQAMTALGPDRQATAPFEPVA